MNNDWIVDGIAPETVLSWARQVAEGAPQTSVILTRASDDGPATMDGRATLLHHDVTGLGTFTVVLWGDRPDRRGGDYVVRHVVPPEFGHYGDGRGPELFARYVAEREAADKAEAEEPDREPVTTPIRDGWPSHTDPISTREAVAELAAMLSTLLFELEARSDGIPMGPEPSAYASALAARLRRPEPGR